MKRSISVIAATVFVLALAATAMAGGTPGSGIQGTLHDLSAGAPGAVAMGISSETRICVFCHTPHHAAKNGDTALQGATYHPLWNHDMSSLNYTLYASSTEPSDLSHQTNAQDTIGQPGGVSKLCLGCHDGSVAVNSYGNYNGGINPSKNTGSAKIGTVSGTAGFQIGAGGDLSNHHPIGFDYADVVSKDDEIADVNSGFINSSRGLKIGDVLWNGKMECTSCHDVHNTKNDGSRFLWVEDSNQSALCRSCHLK